MNQLTRGTVLAFCSQAAVLHAAPRPNIVFIRCDDLGFGDTGSSFQNRGPRSIPPGPFLAMRE